MTFPTVAQHGLVRDTQGPVDVAYLADTVIPLRYFEALGRVLRAMSIIKKRAGAHENRIREYKIGSTGISLGEPLEYFQGVLKGIPTYVGGLRSELETGAGFVLLTQEALARRDMRDLSAWIDAQPEWSDSPFVLLTHRGGGLERDPSAARHLKTLGNVTFVERPFHPTTLVSLAGAALRGRRRQYEARLRLEMLRKSEDQFRTLADSIPPCAGARGRTATSTGTTGVGANIPGPRPPAWRVGVASRPRSGSLARCAGKLDQLDRDGR